MSMTIEEIQAAIVRLEEENAKLIKKKEKKSEPKISLRNVVDPDSQAFLSAEDIPNMLVEAGILKKADKAKAYNFIELFNLHPMAQSKKPDAKGIGKRLYMTGDVKDAISHLLNFPGVRKN